MVLSRLWEHEHMCNLPGRREIVVKQTFVKYLDDTSEQIWRKHLECFIRYGIWSSKLFWIDLLDYSLNFEGSGKLDIVVISRAIEKILDCFINFGDVSIVVRLRVCLERIFKRVCVRAFLRGRVYFSPSVSRIGGIL
ncbi:hypothetical protein AVEN_25377-1 [Araneus ventricosus]|uniref:Uncharacterized protein n=1 Tax=Araneus ventricosus TaxID=182803 RepID=A0A4Y2EIT9_ARAVE|nr:hypothetical protein AVEN_25377-1 [Araneus ventricosus]